MVLAVFVVCWFVNRFDIIGLIYPFRRPVVQRDWLVALDGPKLSLRQLAAVRFTDSRKHFVSEASVYRILKEENLIPTPALHLIKAANEFHGKTTGPNGLWRTNFTYLKVIGWEGFYLSKILDHYSRYVVLWPLCTTVKANDVTAALVDALIASGCDRTTVARRPRLLSDNGSSYIPSDLATWLDDQGMDHARGTHNHPLMQGKIERWHQLPKTASCSRTIACRGSSSGRSPTSSTITATNANTRAPANLCPPMSTSVAAGPLRRRQVNENTIEIRRLLHRQTAAQTETITKQGLRYRSSRLVPSHLKTEMPKASTPTGSTRSRDCRPIWNEANRWAR